MSISIINPLIYSSAHGGEYYVHSEFATLAFSYDGSQCPIWHFGCN